MHAKAAVVVVTLLAFTFIIFPVQAGETGFSSEDKEFIAGLFETGIPLLYQIPEAMNTGIYYGDNSAIANIASDKTSELISFADTIEAYSLGAETSALRDSWLSAAQNLKADLEEYGVLTPGCGSCVSAMNEMYPRLMESATDMNKEFIQFCEINQVSL